MSDIVERLRGCDVMQDSAAELNGIVGESIAEITRLRASVAKLNLWNSIDSRYLKTQYECGNIPTDPSGLADGDYWVIDEGPRGGAWLMIRGMEYLGGSRMRDPIDA